MDQIINNSVLLFFIIISGLIIVGVSILLIKIWTKIFPFTIFRIFIAPGVIVHECSHAVGCLITLAPIKSIKFFEKDGGEVVHGSPKIKIFGPVIISMAPVFGGILVFFLLDSLMNSPFKTGIFGTGLFPGIKHFFHNFFNINWLDWRVWVYIYCIINIAIVMAPSRQDFRNCSWGLFLIGILLFIMDYLNIINGRNIVHSLQPAVIIYFFIIAGCILISLPFYFLVKLIKKS